MIHKNFKRKLLRCIIDNNWITFERLQDDFYELYNKWINDEIFGKIFDELVEEKIIEESIVNQIGYNPYGYRRKYKSNIYRKLKDL